MTLSEAVRYRFFELLGEKGMSIAEVEHKARIPRSTLSHALYSPKAKNYSIETVAAMAKGLGIELKEFYDSPHIANADPRY